MNTFVRAFLLLVLIVPMTSACVPSMGVGGVSFGSYGTYQGYLTQQTLVTTTSMTSPVSIPQSGSAQYSGHAEFWSKGLFQDYFADFDATANFSTRTLTGKITDFKLLDSLLNFTKSSGSVDVAATITGLNSFRADAFSGTYSGNIAGTPASGTVTGNFRGSTAGKIDLGFNGANFYGGAWAE
jgi:hypothetical protein